MAYDLASISTSFLVSHFGVKVFLSGSFVHDKVFLNLEILRISSVLQYTTSSFSYYDFGPIRFDWLFSLTFRGPNVRFSPFSIFSRPLLLWRSFGYLQSSSRSTMISARLGLIGFFSYFLRP